MSKKSKSAAKDRRNKEKRARKAAQRARYEAYKSFLRRIQFVVAQQLPEKRQAGLRKIRSEFVEIVSADPFLPQELLPKEWPFFLARAALAQAK